MTKSITTERKFLAERAVSVKASIRTRMLELASTFDDVIPLGRGDPDFDTPPVIVNAGVTALKDGLHHYTVPIGMPELRTEICKKLKRDNQLDYAPNQIIVCNGCQEALFISIMTLVNPGDEVIVTNQDHEANVSAWRRLAEHGMTIKEWKINPDYIAGFGLLG